MKTKYLWLVGIIVFLSAGFFLKSLLSEEKSPIKYRLGEAKSSIYSYRLFLKDRSKESIESFYTELESYAKEIGFATRVVKIHPVKAEYSFQFWRADYNFAGTNVDSQFMMGMYITGEHSSVEEGLKRTANGFSGFLSRYGELTEKNNGSSLDKSTFSIVLKDEGLKEFFFQEAEALT